MDGNELRANLIASIESSSDWRFQVAGGHPNDTRNERSAKALERLAKSLSTIPVTDPQFSAYWAACYFPPAKDDVLEARIEEQNLIERGFIQYYGFHSEASGDGREFLSQLIKELQKAKRDTG